MGQYKASTKMAKLLEMNQRNHVLEKCSQPRHQPPNPSPTPEGLVLDFGNCEVLDQRFRSGGVIIFPSEIVLILLWTLALCSYEEGPQAVSALSSQH